VLNQLYRYTPLQTSFGANMVALTGGRPKLMNLKELIQAFVVFREEVSRGARFLLNKARDRAHVLVGLGIAVANIDEVIHLIRTAPDPSTAREHPDGARWPAVGYRAADRADRRSAPYAQADGTYKLSEVAGPRHPRSAPAAPDRSWPRRNRRRAEQARRRDRRLSRHPALARPHPRSSRRARGS
jgi:hypothetical protein